MDEEPEFTLDQFREVVSTICESPEDLVRMLKQVRVPVPLERVEADLYRVGAIIDSMTDEEREYPETVDTRRIQRIARGSGTTQAAVQRMLRDFRTLRENWEQVSAEARRRLEEYEEEYGGEFGAGFEE